MVEVCLIRRVRLAVTNLIRQTVGARLGLVPTSRPLLAYLYLTYRCDLSCSYCDDGTGRSYPERRDAHELDTDAARRLLERLRRETDALILTGGEPLLRDDLGEILDAARALRFDPIILYTNGHSLHRRPEVLGKVDLLMVSLDTLDQDKADRIYRRGPGVARQICDNLERAVTEQRRLGFRLYLNICITPETVDDVAAVIDYAIDRGVGFTALPMLRAAYAAHELVGDPRYEALITRMIRLKREGFPVMGTLPYLEGIRAFRRFRCLPTLLLRVKPNGHVLYPCNKIDGDAGSLLEPGGYSAALRRGAARHGALPRCDARCHDTCYMDFSLCVQHPSLLLAEGYYRFKGWVGGRGHTLGSPFGLGRRCGEALDAPA
jgi:MoaA/NifB/PqqE/SkfB family radical SAM enzyme